MTEVIVQWSISPSLGITDPTYAIGVSKTVRATAVLLNVYWGETQGIANLDSIRNYVRIYREAGFKVYIDVACGSVWMLGPAYYVDLLTMDIEGIGFEGTFAAGAATPIAKEDALIAIKNSTAKTVSYYHGDGFIDVDSVKVRNAGLTVYCTWGWMSNGMGQGGEWGIGWSAGAWLPPKRWAMMWIWNRPAEAQYSSADDIRRWYDIIPKDDPPEAIHWWLTTCNHNPDSNQVAAMRDVSLKFNPKPGGINFLLVIGAITAAGLLIGLMITRKKRS